MTLKYTDMYTDIPWDDIVRLEQNKQDIPFSIAWVLGRFCNYSCSYCYDFAHSDKVDHQPLEVYQNVLTEVKTQARANGFNSFFCNFSGGEPSAYKDFLKLAEFYSSDKESAYNDIAMTTNLSPGLKWWQRYLTATAASGKRRFLAASFHHEFADYNEFTEKCLMLKEAGVRLIVNQVMEAKYFYEALDRCENWRNAGIPVTVKPQKSKAGNQILMDSYTPEMIDILKKGFPLSNRENYTMLYRGIKLWDSKGNIHYIDQSERLNSLDRNKFRGWKCEAGFKSVVIRGKNVLRAHSCSDSPLGNITDGFQLYNEPKTCMTKVCITSTDSKLTKWRDTGPPIGPSENTSEFFPD